MCAGVWHNLILYVYTYVSLGGGLKLLLILLGWQSLEGRGGVSVVHIRANSPLASHLPPSTVIYQLDDFPLTNNIQDWNSHLFHENGRIDANQFPFGQSGNSSISCFNTFPSKQNVSFKKQNK
jgi:S2P endopeptidase